VGKPEKRGGTGAAGVKKDGPDGDVRAAGEGEETAGIPIAGVGPDSKGLGSTAPRSGDEAAVAGFATTPGGFTDGKPIMVRAIWARTVAAGGDEAGEETGWPLSSPAEGNDDGECAPGIKEGRGDGRAAGGTGPTAGGGAVEAAPSGLPSPQGTTAGARAGPRSMEISP